jgi:hypothetical protein
VAFALSFEYASSQKLLLSRVALRVHHHTHSLAHKRTPAETLLITCCKLCLLGACQLLGCSVIVEQAIPEKLSIASYSTREMYPAAQRFLTEMSDHFQRAVSRATNMTFRIRCSAGDAIVKASKLRECLLRVRFENQGLNMAVERYICRSTPDYAALSLPAGAVVADIKKWAAAVFEGNSAAVNNIQAALEGKFFAP